MKHTYRNTLIRDWQPSDRDAVATVIGTVLAEYGLVWEPDGADSDVLNIETAYLQTGGEFWTIESENQVVGTSGYYPVSRGDRAVEIRKMYLLPSVRGQGLGRFLLQLLESSIQAKGYHTIWIETASVLKEAIALYERMGYEPETGVETPRCDRLYVKRLQHPVELT